MKKLIPFILIAAILLTGIVGWLRWQEANAEAYYDEDDAPRKHTTSATHSEPEPEETSSSQTNVSLAPDSPFRINGNNVPVGDGMVRYVGETVFFNALPPYEEENPNITVTIGNEELVTFSGYDLMGRETYVCLNFLQAGETTLTLTLEATGQTEVLRVIIKEEYDFNPGKERLTPQDVVTCFENAAKCWGMEVNDYVGDTCAYMTLSEEKLTWTEIRNKVSWNCRQWWLKGYRSVNVCYRSENNGNYSYHIYLS
jgi:hypothetical protein